MKAIYTLVLAAAVVLGTAGCRSKSTVPGYRGPVIFGTVSYKARIALPPDAVLTMRLLDVTRRDAPAVVLTERSVSGPGQPPLAFELPYPPEAVRPDRRTVVEARIEVAGRTRLYSATAHVVTTETVMQPQEIWVEPAP
jgi:putative lipoprotein